jgi:hypothetical protein
VVATCDADHLTGMDGLEVEDWSKYGLPVPDPERVPIVHIANGFSGFP